MTTNSSTIRDLIESAARLTEGMTADEMDEMEREIEAERAAARDEADMLAEDARYEAQQLGEE